MSAIKSTELVRNAVYFGITDEIQIRAVWFPISKQAFNADTGEYIGHVHHDKGQMCVCREMSCDPLNN